MKSGWSFRHKYFAGDHHARRPIAERRYAFAFYRDPLTELYTTETGPPWRPRSGSRVIRRALASVMIGGPNFLNAHKLALTQVLIQRCLRVAFRTPPCSTARRYSRLTCSK
jgi:hypothetical protein